MDVSQSTVTRLRHAISASMGTADGSRVALKADV